MLIVNFFVKNKDWGRGGLINFPPLKRGGLLKMEAYLRGFTVCEIEYPASGTLEHD